MRRVALLPFALVLSMIPLAAQAPGGAATAGMEPLNGNGKLTIVVLPPAAPACPVQMHALQGPGGGLLAARNSPRIDGPSQRIHLVLATGKAGPVASAKVTVQGLSGKNRAVETLSTTGPIPDRTQTLNVSFTAEDLKSVAADLTLRGFTAVLSIQLNEITYADGSSWKVADAQTCSVAPDRLVRVAGW